MRRAVLTVLVLGLCVSSAFAQATGQINGVVSDNSGGVVPGVTVTAVESGTGISRDTVTGANGRYSVRRRCGPRPTRFSAELTGFRTVRQTDVVLQANQNLTLNITLELGDLSETVTVAGEAATVDITSATISEVVDSKRIVELPLNGRDAARLSMLVSGMVVTAGQPGIGQDDSRRAAPVDQRHRVAAGVVPPGRHEPHRLVLPAEPAVPVPRRAAGVLDSDQQLQRGAGRQRRRGRQRRHPLWHQQLPRRRVRLRARPHVQLEELLPARAGLPEAQAVPAATPAARSCATRCSSSRGWQGTTIQNVGGTLNNTVPTAAMRAGDFSAITTPLRDPNGGFVPEQPDSGQPVRSGLGERAEVPAGRSRQRRRRARAGAAPHRPERQPDHREGRHAAQPEQPGERAVLLRSLHERSDVSPKATC